MILIVDIILKLSQGVSKLCVHAFKGFYLILSIQVILFRVFITCSHHFHLRKTKDNFIHNELFGRLELID